MNVFSFQVTGQLDFPVDMLRHDACFPYSQVDVANITIKQFPYASKEEARATPTITLIHRDSVARWMPTEDRWASFGWPVLPGSTKRL